MKALKILGGLVAVLVLLLGAVVAQAWFFRPLSINVFFEKAFFKVVLDEPELLSQLRILEPLGIDFHNDELSDVSPARTLERAELARKDLETLRAYDRASLDPGQQLSYDALEWFIASGVAGEPFIFHDYPVNQLFGIQNDLPDFMINAHQVNDAESARDYVARLNKFPQKIGQAVESVKLRESKGVVPPKFTVDKVLDEMRGFIKPAATEHVLYAHLRDALGKLDGVSEDERAAILKDAEAAVANAVVPAYKELIACFESLQAKNPASNGVWALPDGDKYYAWAVRHQTTTDLTPDQLHQTGLDEVARIEGEMEAILEAQGYAGGGTVGARLTKISQEPRFQYPDSDEGRKQILADYQAIIDEIDKGLDPYFGRRPKVGVKVERVPEFREKTAAGAYYQQPPMDGSRPGVFYANLRDVKAIYKWGMRTLSYHEAIPGHHFQIAIQQELQGVPTFRKLGLFTAYTEGWALYAERLAKELGFQEDPFNDLGRLQDEMLRAVRLVVDTGIHHKRWTREQSIQYMLDKTGQPEVDVVSEVERYFVMPGQALAYKTGQLKILALREKAKAELGKGFELKEFHDLVLGVGALPLSVLEAQVDGWIAKKKG